MPTPADAKIRAILAKLKKEDVERLIGKRNRTHAAIQEAVMGWQAMLFAGLKQEGILRDEQEDSALRLLASSMVVLGTLITWTFALGIREGMRRKTSRRRKG